MSLRIAFLGVNLRSIRKAKNILLAEEEKEDWEIESEYFVNELISYVYTLSDIVKTHDLISEDLGQLLQLYYPEYAIKGRPLFGFEIQNSGDIYGFLLNSELEQFIKKIKKLSPDYQSKFELLKHCSKTDLQKTISWLENIQKQQLSVLFYTI